jgi:hypothetical protein
LEDLNAEVEINSVLEMIRENINILAKESTAEPLVLHPSPFGVEIAISKFEEFKSPGSDEICYCLRSITSAWNKEELISGRSLLLQQFARRLKRLSVMIIVGHY